MKLLRLQSGTHCFAGCGNVVDLVAFIYVFILLSWHFWEISEEVTKLLQIVFTPTTGG